MTLRSTSSLYRFANPFVLPGRPEVLPAGLYEVLGEETLISGSNFQTYRRTASFLLVRGQDKRAGRGTRHRISEAELADMLARDRDPVAALRDGMPVALVCAAGSGALPAL